MLDAKILPKLQPHLKSLALRCQQHGLSADQVSLIGFAIGIWAAIAIAMGGFVIGLLLLLASRVMDGVDGALARLSKPTDAGGFLDITLDFLFYAAIPLAFAMADPAANALAACVLLAAFIGTGSSFLAFAVLAQKRGISASAALPNKSFFFLGGLTEGAETLIAFILMCLLPQYFAVIAYVFALLCIATIVTRIYGGYRQLREGALAPAVPAKPSSDVVSDLPTSDL